MNLTEFMQQYKQDTFEYISGESVDIHELPLGLEKIARRLAEILSTDNAVRFAGEVLIHTPFVLLDPSEVVRDTRTPDVLFIRKERVQRHPTGVLLSTPDLAVEIVSRAQEIPAMYKKTLGYLKLGVQQVWLIDPDMHTLSIYQQGTKEMIVLGTRHKLKDNPLFPGLEFSIVNLFE
jgi:Uma2 family endonuclease